ncbi:Silver-binding protein [Salmonella enterica subsp. enterica serovar Reading]|nr:Silver-binding protein [Salmonella enterica subsp. enterica serovar Reading]
MGSCAAPSAKGDDKFITTDYLQQCPHETMTNGSADAHQKMVESHQKMMGNNTVSTTVPSTSYAAMNEHERAAVAHEFMNNGQSGPHQAMAEAHRRMINAG